MAGRLRTTLLVLAGGVVVALASAQNVYAHGDDEERAPPPPPAPGLHPDDWGGHSHRFGHPGMEFHGLGLTPEQHRKMEIIVLNARVQELQQQDAHHPAAMAEPDALLNPGDPGYASAVQEAKKRAADRIQRMSDLRTQLYNVLTPEQKAEFARRVAERREHPDAHHDEEGVRPPPVPAVR